MLRQREEWIRFSYSNEDTKDGEEEKAGVVDRRLNVPSAHHFGRSRKGGKKLA
jgi:hypothetical protein